MNKYTLPSLKESSEALEPQQFNQFNNNPEVLTGESFQKHLESNSNRQIVNSNPHYINRSNSLSIQPIAYNNATAYPSPQPTGTFQPEYFEEERSFSNTPTSLVEQQLYHYQQYHHQQLQQQQQQEEQYQQEQQQQQFQYQQQQQRYQEPYSPQYQVQQQSQQLPNDIFYHQQNNHFNNYGPIQNYYHHTHIHDNENIFARIPLQQDQQIEGQVGNSNWTSDNSLIRPLANQFSASSSSSHNLPARTSRASGNSSHNNNSRNSFPKEESSRPFIVHLSTIIKLHNDVVLWDSSGTIVLVLTGEKGGGGKMINEILPKYFNHKSTAAFHRQLNLYEFTHISRAKTTAIVSNLPELQNLPNFNPKAWRAWKHPSFVRDNLRKREHMKPKQSKARRERKEGTASRGVGGNQSSSSRSQDNFEDEAGSFPEESEGGIYGEEY